ncbi:hypothetical protein VB780_16965 [Leptolyngbya sp. CCNP1308]|uniref:hypothetical protein n=1 Tax=Leptolyngbya sp. CCNP1308 TaxID=3110255 RepID=UPI002B21C368|nr:hypothetical protein [Leptolyngbya sp. CCNP1308]MEA5450274.1 hypothetical protein [Leptolyngbya sp. CCNP1308]
MGAIAFLVLIILGALLATVGSLIGAIDAFQVSPVWGLLSLFIPFALFVYWIKFRGRKWARNSFLIFLGGLLSMLASIPFLGGFIAQRAQQAGAPLEESIPAEEVPIESIPIPDEQVVAEEEFAEPLVPVAPQLSPIARADLIQSTDPNERLQQINNSRIDPFAVVPIPPPPPPVVAPPTPPTGGATPGTATAAAPTRGAGATTGGGGGGGTGSPVATAPGTSGTPGGGGASPGSSGAGGQQPATRPPLAPLPQLPQPTLAEAVLVTGVMTIGSENFAVVETSAGSQYVRAGQRVSNGQVLVKRIDMRGSDPIVVLEENGIEVSRPVGSPSAAAEPSV